jgi:conjugative relaxase-like TrwC/TraI family protein
MLSIGKLAAGQEAYYLDAIARGAEDYYREKGEVPGRWAGGGAEQLGLDGAVGDAALTELLSGFDPVTDMELARLGRRVTGFDLTFSAPKSVSLLWGLGERYVSDSVVAGHETAVDAALGYLERHAVFVRRGHAGAEVQPGGGLVAAAFRHRTSRAGDPQLHTHVVVANAAQGGDGRWSALDARHLYAHARTAGYLYEAQLRAELSGRLGVRWGRVENGVADLEGIDWRILVEFSRRRAQILEVLAERGIWSASAARVATLDTRTAKEVHLATATLRADWARRLDSLGHRPKDLIDAALRPQREAEQRSAQAPAALGRQLTDHASHFDRRDVLRALAEDASQGCSINELEHAADDLLADAHIVPLAPSLYGTRYSTTELLTVERHLVDDALARRGQEAGVVTDVSTTVAAYPNLSDEQVEMLRRLTTAGDGIAVVVGAAGTGKTFALDAARLAWEGDGYTVIGCALAARAAAELQASAGIRSTTIAALLGELDRPDVTLPPRAVLIVDEAAMVGTRTLLHLAEHSRRADAKLVLVGDHHQLPEIEAGGAFRTLVRRVGSIDLTENRRQQDPVERAALAQLRAGNAHGAVERLSAHGRIVLSPTAEQTRDRMVHEWLDSRRRGEDAIMLALRRTDVDDLNHRARKLLRSEGAIGDDRLEAAGRAFAVGDAVIALRNDRRLGLLNGQRAIVVEIDRNTRGMRVDAGDECVDVPAAYLDAGCVDHAYAMTAHKAQGLTCDRSLLLGNDDVYREAGYTALTRGRLENRLYAVVPDGRAALTISTGGDVVENALGRSRQQLAAIDLRVTVEPSAMDDGVGIDL